MSMSVDGLVSGMDTTALITGLLQAEAAPQAMLKTRLSNTEKSASAYRTVNTTFAAVRAAAETAMKPDTWTSTKGTSSATSVTVAVGASPTTGSMTFTVPQVATTHGAVSTTRWGSASAPANLTTIDVRTPDGSASKGTITLDGTESLTQVATKINGSGRDLVASVVQVRPGEFALQVDATKSGSAAGFSLAGNETFKDTSIGKDAELKIGTTANAYSVYSPTNTFTGVLGSATLTVSKEETVPVTVSVVSDPDAIAAKLQSLVDAVNASLSTVKTYTNNAKGSTAALKGDYAVTQLSGQLLNAASFAVGGDGSPAKVGFQLSKDGKTVVFDKTKFLSALKDDPVLTQRMVAGTAASNGADGIAGRLLAVSKSSSDSTTGSLVKLAEGQDSMLKDIQSRIDSWDLRLAKRKEMLTHQFSAMETALSSLKNQSTWLAGQINSLPSGS
jgi:flagellar capping protein FliD